MPQVSKHQILLRKMLERQHVSSDLMVRVHIVCMPCRCPIINTDTLIPDPEPATAGMSPH
jgi:hypothetical protein